MSKQRKAIKPHGQIRRSQLITTFGPGAMMDLPDHSVMVGGLENWKGYTEEIIEPRLLGKLMQALNVGRLRMYAPPASQEDLFQPPTGIVAWQFPEWFVTQDAISSDDADTNVRSRALVHRSGLTRGKWIDSDRKKQSVVPVRFVRACRHGHIGDIDWYQFVHKNPKNTCRRQLWFDELDATGDISSIQVRCSCGDKRMLREAVGYDTKALGKCDGNRPWLGPYSSESCNQMSRLLVRTASNCYFSQKMSVISLPKRNEAVAKAVDQAWDFLQLVQREEDIAFVRRGEKVNSVIQDFSDAEIWAEINSRREGTGVDRVSVKQAELETLIASKEELGNDKPDGDFYARALPASSVESPLMSGIERVVLVHRLREVVAQVGFTRFEASSPNIEGDLELGVERAPLARETSWVPAIENRGEGVFIQFRKDEIDKWLKRSDVQEYGEKLWSGFKLWKEEHKTSKMAFPGLQFVMLHSFSHLLITSISLECGYPASSVRERVYSIPNIGYGILLYTGSTDAEGTLGGLIEAGRQVEKHIAHALRYGELCSNDPVCASHAPDNKYENRFLHGAACHGCLLISETSCEQYNQYLDRNLVVKTIENLGIEFFNLSNSDSGALDSRVDSSSVSSEEVVSLDSVGEFADSGNTKLVQLPAELSTKFNLDSQGSWFKFLTSDDPLPKKNSIVIIRDGTEGSAGDIYCGKIMWQEQVSVDGAGGSMMVHIRGEVKNKIEIQLSDWESFRPLAVLVN